MAPFELTEGFFPIGYDGHLLPVIQPHEFIESFFDICFVGNFDQERRAQFTWCRKDGIVHIQLVLDLRLVENPFDTDHFLNLKLERGSILKHQGHPRAD